MELHPNEIQLILLIRNRVRFGFIEIITKDGIPMRITKRVEDYSLNVDNGPFDEYPSSGTM